MSDHGHGHHIVGPATYLKNLIFLMAMMFLTVFAATIHFGAEDSQALNLIVAMLIAASKTAAILLIFMGVKFSSGLVRITSVVAFAFLVIMFSFTFADYSSRSWHSTFENSPYTGKPTTPAAPHSASHDGTAIVHHN
jgi:caa(3)-type oxidase subunit IV